MHSCNIPEWRSARQSPNSGTFEREADAGGVFGPGKPSGMNPRYEDQNKGERGCD